MRLSGYSIQIPEINLNSFIPKLRDRRMLEKNFSILHFEDSESWCKLPPQIPCEPTLCLCVCIIFVCVSLVLLLDSVSTSSVSLRVFENIKHVRF